MNGLSLVVVLAGDVSQDQAQSLLQRVLTHWPSRPTPEPALLAADQILENPALLNTVGVAWLMVDSAPAAAVFELAGILIDRQLPTAITRFHGSAGTLGALDDEGFLICPSAADPAATCAALAALVSQAPAIRDLKQEVRLLRAHEGGLAGQISRMDEELRLAAQLQREFLPTEMPQVHDVQLRALWRPAGYVSGDIYEAIRLDEDHLGLFVADATGHGVPAALMTMYIKRSLKLKATDSTVPAGYRIVEPREVLARLNRDFVAQQNGHVHFATACYALIDCRRRVMQFARAGHPYPILLHADGQTQQLEPDGGLLGIFPDEVFEQVEVPLQPGDRLLLYTDGFEVAFPEADPQVKGRQKLASTRYCREFEDLRHGSLDQALGRLEKKLDTQAGSLNQRDDLTVLCLHLP